jgi:cellulose synthase/poly-beta-1,6-N-acetylglucosamine synthase-like glycosyltransferase
MASFIVCLFGRCRSALALPNALAVTLRAVPRVSVIIPAYNAEPYLAETLASVEAQTYRDWEVVVADDSSTDGTVETAVRFGERFTVLRSTSNEGPAAARNRALAAANGELLAFLDADDLWLPAYLDRIVGLYDESRERDDRVGIVTCDARILGPAGYLTKTYMQLNGFPGGVTVGGMLAQNRIFVGSLSPRLVVEEAGGFCPEIFGTEDYDLWLRILELDYRVVATREALTVYRLRPESVAGNLVRMARSQQVTYCRALERGKLTPRERRIAIRQLRLQRALEQLGLIISERRAGGLPFARLALHIGLFVRVAAENPNRWGSAARVLVGRGSPLSQVAR